MAEAKKLEDKSWGKKITTYVKNRQNEDGGYTFCQHAESNAQDTYYALEILSMLSASSPNVEETVKWLNELRAESIFSIYYVTKALLLCREKINNVLKKRIAAQIDSLVSFNSTEVYSEISSEYTTTFMTLELANLLGFEKESSKLLPQILNFKNKDGGFGSQNHSNINSTYFALASLSFLKMTAKKLDNTIDFVRKCEKPNGGFTVIPIGAMPYIEHTYYGVLTLDLLGEKCRYPSQTIDFVLECQNRNGGFARSEIGISTFENTFQAISILKKLAHH